MRSFLVGLVAMSMAAPAVVAQQTPNRMTYNNIPYLVISTRKHSGTNLNYNWPPVNHPDYSNGNGIPNGTVAFRSMNKEGHNRAAASPRTVQGFNQVLRSSAATPNGANSNGYIHDMSLVNAVVDAATGALVSDRGAGRTVYLNIGSMANPSNGQTYTVNHTTATPFVGSFNDVSVEWTFQEAAPGVLSEQDNPHTQGQVGNWRGGPTPFDTWGWWEFATGSLTLGSDQQWTPWAFWLEDEAVVRMHSDWGQQRIGPLNPPLRGHAIGTYFNDLATNAAGGNGGWDVWSTADAGNLAVPLLNLGPFFPAFFGFGGRIIEVNPGDPALAALHPVYFLTLDPAGQGQGPKLFVPQLGGGAGLYIGMEFLIFDINTLAPTGDTPSIWTLIQ